VQNSLSQRIAPVTGAVMAAMTASAVKQSNAITDWKPGSLSQIVNSGSKMFKGSYFSILDASAAVCHLKLQAKIP
jgi:hypothetical protein